VEIWDTGMPPREEQAAAVRELSAGKGTNPALERRRLLERIPLVAWIVFATVVATVLVAWFIART
jgi:hypothetical protein